MVSLPIGEAGELLGVDDTVARIDAWEVDLADELDRGGLVRVGGAAVHPHGVDTVFMDTLKEGAKGVEVSMPRRTAGCISRYNKAEAYVRGAENRAIPVRHEKILGILKTVGAGLYRGTNLSASCDAKRHQPWGYLQATESSRSGGWGKKGTIPAPRPFSPFSSSSRSLKFLGTLAAMSKLSCDTGRIGVKCMARCGVKLTRGCIAGF